MASNSSSSPSNLFLGETSSTCLTHSVTVAHKFQVTDFSLLEGIGVGKHVSSTPFSVGGCDWSLNVYPDGTSAGEKIPHVSVYLCLLKGPTPGVRVKFRLGLLDKDGKLVLRPQGSALSKTFLESAGRDCGLDKFMRKPDLQEFLHRNNDCFTVRCALTVIKESQSSEDNKIAVPPSNLCQDYAAMLKKKEGADVTFNVDGQLFPAHRCVLAARSPFFQAEFFGPMKKKPAQDIMIGDIKPTIFEALLQFMYTDSLPDDYNAEDNVTVWQHLLVAADLYGLERLRLICEDKLCCSINVQTVASTFALAEQHSCVQLKDKCLQFIASRAVLGAVMETDGFKDLVASRPLVMKEILDKVAVVKDDE
uniref:BTB domain-containing protein n=2 Tax=Setaria viridis TaxID=4556 RepID=A0A4U6U0D6_SETVI|nr:hypothetical protein SEVIR_7G256900v2 [Setaria viridis]